ncbi:DUF624 domain-containing protein [Oerskovia flava]|uniref:DUF624 domain-containing protein n=1 Tax=Oerskovia flava TaxID=2986422 RepID=UPI00223F31A7|nr:DUF624 domain-containing protein [Oerskovia sp. JB1-3-2]
MTTAATAATASPGVHRPRRRFVSQDTYDLIFSTVYTGLATNVMLVVACFPLVVLAMTTDPATSWPVLALVVPFCTPAVVAAFGVFSAFTSDASTQVVRTFWRTYRRQWRRSLVLGVLSTALVVILAVDIAAVWGSIVGAVAIPVFAMLTVLTVVTALVAATALPDHPEARLRDLFRVALFVGVRRWYLTLPSLVVLSMLASLVAARPAVGLGVALAPLLFAAWGATRYALNATLTPRPAAGP